MYVLRNSHHRLDNMKLLVVVLSCVALATAFAAPSAVKTDQARNDDIKAKPADYQSPDVKHLCLKESRQYNCRYVGCPALANCTADVDCQDCQTHTVGQSDVVCCNKPGYDSDKSEGLGDLFTPSLKVGTCDWDFDIVNSFCAGEEGCENGIELENGAIKAGTAWATCYMNADAEYCGHPFCDRMVMSFQGGVYVLPAYSKTPGGLEASGVTTDGSGQGMTKGCFTSGLTDIIEQVEAKLELRSSGLLKKLAKRSTKRSTNKSTKKSIPATKKSDDSATTQSTKPSSADSGRFATIESSDYYHKSTNHTYYYGFAIMMTGPVTVTSMKTHMEYSRGMLQYTPYFEGELVEAGTQPTAKGAIVTPNQYDIMLISGKGGDSDYYKQEEKYYKPEYKPEYKEEERSYGHEGERYYKEDPDREAYYPHDGPRYRN